MAFIDYKTCEECKGKGKRDVLNPSKPPHSPFWMENHKCPDCEGRGHLREIVTDKPEMVRAATPKIQKSKVFTEDDTMYVRSKWVDDPDISPLSDNV